MSCFVSDGWNLLDSSLVDEDLCGDVVQSVDGDPHVVLQESCSVPCPGTRPTAAAAGDLSLWQHAGRFLSRCCDVVQVSAT